MKKYISMILAFLTFALLTASHPSQVLANNNAGDPYGVYYRHARVYGKMVHYDPDRDICVVYGSVLVKEPGGAWRTLESKKYHTVQPATHPVRKTLSNAANKTVALEGTLNAWPGQKDEVLMATSVQFDDYQIEIPEWYAFGKTLKTEQIYKFNLNIPNDFIDVLAGLARVMSVPQDKRLTPKEVAGINELITNPKTQDERRLSAQVKSKFYEDWNTKWLVSKNGTTANELRAGVGGWQFYRGLLGYGNCYVEEAPVIRKDLTYFMDAVTKGGGTPEEEGDAIMCAYINVVRQRDETGVERIVKVTASGALYDTVPGFYQALKDPSEPNLETWRLEGWTKKDAELMENKLCWLSGRRVLVYAYNEETGKSVLIDKYFSLNNYLTRAGFDNLLDISNKTITEGGI